MFDNSVEKNIRVEEDEKSEDNFADKNKRIYDFFRRKKDVIQNQLN